MPQHLFKTILVSLSAAFLLSACSSLPRLPSAESPNATLVLKRNVEAVENKYSASVYSNAKNCSNRVRLPAENNIFLRNKNGKPLVLAAGKTIAFRLESGRFEGKMWQSCTHTLAFTPEAGKNYTLINNIHDDSCYVDIIDHATQKSAPSFERRTPVIAMFNKVKIEEACTEEINLRVDGYRSLTPDGSEYMD